MKKGLIIFSIILTFMFSSLSVFASTSDRVLTNQKEIEVEVENELLGFIPEGYSYYLTHQWEWNGDFYIAFFRSVPILEKVELPESDGRLYYHMTESDGSNPLYYRFTSYDDMLSYLMFNDSSNVDYVYFKDYVSYVRLNLSNSNMFYSNFDLTFTDGSTYFSRNPYTETEIKTVLGDKTFIVNTFDNHFVFSNLVNEIISIIPLVICIVISIIALKKAIDFLRNIMRSV